MAVESPSTSASSGENIVGEQVTSNIREPDSEQIVLLLRVAEGLFAAGDLSAARISLRRAAKTGNARAALLLGATYDPGFLGWFGVGSSHTDLTAARTWYEVAREFGSSDARRRLNRLAHDEPWGDLPSRP
jgi:TPR repeat protein